MVAPLFCCPQYLVDDRGFVISKSGKPLKPSINHSGYQIVNLMIDQKRVGMSVHTAVARTFCDGYAPGLQVNHKDGNKQNNSASNLEWVTPQYNTWHAIHELGFNPKGETHHSAKRVIGRSKITGEILYDFPCVMTAARYFADNDEKRARHIQNIISRLATGHAEHKSYRGCVWQYIQLGVA